jgi:hypothetical protein
MAKALTPFDSEYYARSRSKKDEETLTKYGWRELTQEEARKFIENKKRTRGNDIQMMDALKGYENDTASLRWYRDHGVCIYHKETDSFFSLEEGDEVEKTGITLSDLRTTRKGVI